MSAQLRPEERDAAQAHPVTIVAALQWHDAADALGALEHEGDDQPADAAERARAALDLAGRRLDMVAHRFIVERGLATQVARGLRSLKRAELLELMTDEQRAALAEPKGSAASPAPKEEAVEQHECKYGCGRKAPRGPLTRHEGACPKNPIHQQKAAAPPAAQLVVRTDGAGHAQDDGRYVQLASRVKAPAPRKEPPPVQANAADPRDFAYLSFEGHRTACGECSGLASLCYLGRAFAHRWARLECTS